MKRFRLFGALASLSMLLSGCMTIEGMNSDMRKIDTAWSLESQKYGAGQLHRLVSADYETTFNAVKKTFTDLQMSIDKVSTEKGFLISKNEAPKPLTITQWNEVRELENPKLSKIAGWMYSIPEHPKGQFVTIKASVKSVDNQSEISLDYFLEIPEYEDMGIIPPKHVAPHAVKLASEMFWKQLEANLAHTKQIVNIEHNEGEN
jgi:predicted small secreted protein